jgi:N-acyl homoserine lactone hydrolase
MPRLPISDRHWTQPLLIFAWVIEHPEVIIIVDTGETSRSSQPGYFPWWHPYLRTAVRTYVEPIDELSPQLESLGLSVKDVRWLVLTHLHTDHAGGLYHFPDTEILVSSKEYQVALGLRCANDTIPDTELCA